MFSPSKPYIPIGSRLLANKPPLPKIADASLRGIVFSPRIQSDKASWIVNSNRRLEWAGDAALHFHVTLLLDKLFPHVAVHVVATIRSDVTSNTCLARISKEYSLLDQVKHSRHLTEEQWETLNSNEKSHADIFECYMAAMWKSSSKNSKAFQAFVDKLFTPLVQRKYAEVMTQLPESHNVPQPPWKNKGKTADTKGKSNQTGNKKPAPLNLGTIQAASLVDEGEHERSRMSDADFDAWLEDFIELYRSRNESPHSVMHDDIFVTCDEEMSPQQSLNDRSS